VRFDVEIDIDRPPEDVFALLTDIGRLPEWQGSAVSAEADGPLGEGARIREQRRLFGREYRVVHEVAVFDPPHRFDVRSVEGPLPLTVSHTLEPSGGGTHLEVVAEAKPKGMLRFAAGAAAKAAEGEFRRDFERLKELLESRQA
jgi:uncharacterized protein YndB with AHSA1/START domain